MDPVAFVFLQFVVVLVPSFVVSYIAYCYASERWQMIPHGGTLWFFGTFGCIVLGVAGGAWLHIGFHSSFWLSLVVVPFSGIVSVAAIAGLSLGMMRLRKYVHDLGIAMREDNDDRGA